MKKENAPLIWSDLKPREKLRHLGAGALSDSELLAIFLRTGTPGQNVMALAGQLLQEFGSLYAILSAEKSAFCHIKGIGEAKLAQLHAIAELARRFFSARLLREDVLTSPEITLQYLQSMLANQKREVFMTLFLDNQHRVMHAAEMFAGSINCVEVHPREIIREALRLNAAALILAHNHPSGCAEPSLADRDITQCIQQACLWLNIRLLDHLVIGKGEFVSFAERGWL